MSNEKPENQAAELSEKDLEQAAGGTGATQVVANQSIKAVTPVTTDTAIHQSEIKINAYIDPTGQD